MLITITGKHVEITPAIRERAEEKAGKLPRFFDNLTQVEIIIESTGGGHSVELVAHAERFSPLVAREIGQDILTCIDGAVHKMERQLSKLKERQRDHKSTPIGEIVPPEIQTD
jgi:putative sigma-54 modulation protein